MGRNVTTLLNVGNKSSRKLALSYLTPGFKYLRGTLKRHALKVQNLTQRVFACMTFLQVLLRHSLGEGAHTAAVLVAITVSLCVARGSPQVTPMSWAVSATVFGVPLGATLLQGYLAYKTRPPPRTLQ